MVQIKQIKELLKLFDDKILFILSLFEKKFGLRNPLFAWRNGFISRTGFLDDQKTIEYSFHGAGCTIEFNDGAIISFDFLDETTINFDFFKFKLFVESLSIKNLNLEESESIFYKIKSCDQA